MTMISKEQPIISVRGGFLRSLENNVAIIHALGFETHIKIFRSSSRQYQTSLTLLVENVRGREVSLNHHSGVLQHVIRSKTSIMFDVTGCSVQKIDITYPHQSEEFDFMFLGDIHGVFGNLQQIIQTSNTLDPLFIMLNGDMTHSGRLEDYHILSDMISHSHVPFFTSIGNHDKRARGGRATYRKMLAPFYYSFSVKNTKFIVLDSSRKRGLQKFPT